MAYDDPRFLGETAYRDNPRFGSSGFDETPEVDRSRDYASSDYAAPDYAAEPVGERPVGERPVGGSRSRPASGLGVSRQPLSRARNDKEKDRLSVHLLWEGVLLLFGLALLYLLHDSSSSAFEGAEFRSLVMFAAIVGFLSVGVGLSVRAAVPNLAIGPVAYAAAMFFADRSDQGLIPAALTTILIACGLAVVTAAIAVGFQVPSWAASLGVGIAVMVWLQRQQEVSVVAGAYQPESHSIYWFLGFAVLSIAASLFGLIGPIRRTIGGYRPDGDPALRPSPAAVTTAILAIIGSTILASLSGVLLALSTAPLPAGENGLALSSLALGVVFLGGTSAHGRRGGVFGTVLGVVLLVVLWHCGEARGWDLSLLAIGAAAILAGLVVTRLIETFGRPPLDDDDLIAPLAALKSDQPVAPPDPESEDSWPSESSRGGGWTSQLSARTSDDRWGTGERWSSR